MAHLSARQLAILMSVYLESTSHTVKSLSEKLNVTKAVVSRALDTLTKHGFVKRAPDPSDRRSVIVTRTSVWDKIRRRGPRGGLDVVL